MTKRVNKLVYLALIPVVVTAMLSGSRPEEVYHRLSSMLLVTASMEAAANGGAIGEPLAVR